MKQEVQNILFFQISRNDIFKSMKENIAEPIILQVIHKIIQNMKESVKINCFVHNRIKLRLIF